MKALVFHKPKDVRVETVPDPKIENASDVVIRVTATSICGSDLHLYNGYIPQKHPLVLGHEFMGVVEEAGPRVTSLKRGDRVVVPAMIACGACYFCTRGLPAHCEKSNPVHYGPDGGLKDYGGGVFGMSDAYGPYAGGQAEYARVPYADFGPRKVPDGVPDERALFLGDVIPTGWSAAEWCELKGGETVVVFGCGPVGLMAMKAARLLGATRVVGVDPVRYRRDMAEQVALADTIDPHIVDPVETIRAFTSGRGADAVIDAVGIEAEHGWAETVSNVLHRQTGTTKVLQDAMRAVRRGGVVSMIGMYSGKFDNFPVGQLFEKALRLRGGAAPVHACIDRLMVLVEQGKLTAEDIVTHRFPLDDGPEAYQIFNDKEQNCVKVVLQPWVEREASARAAEMKPQEAEPATALPVLGHTMTELGSRVKEGGY